MLWRRVFDLRQVFQFQPPKYTALRRTRLLSDNVPHNRTRRLARSAGHAPHAGAKLTRRIVNRPDFDAIAEAQTYDEEHFLITGNSNVQNYEVGSP